MEGIGNTPLLPLWEEDRRIFAKMEMGNMTGSVKIRPAARMLAEGVRQGLLRPGGTVVEATSGNMGIALAALSASRGYGCVIVMPEDASRERKYLMERCGAKVMLSPAAEGMAGAMERAQELVEGTPGAFWTDQFGNPANPVAHYETTGPEIWKDTGGGVDIFVAAVGTGGTISGVGRYLKEKKPEVRIVGVLPAQGDAIPGIGPGFVPPVLDESLVDTWVYAPADAAAVQTQVLAKTHGILAGPSAGAAYYGACLVADLPENRGKTVVTLFADSAERYLSLG